MIRPIGKYVMVRRHDPELPPSYMTPSRIIIPDQAKMKGRRGTILEVGEGVESEDLMPGTDVVISWFSGTPYHDADIGDVEFFNEIEIPGVWTS